MIKDLLRPFYIKLFNKYNKIKYFILPNLFTKTQYSYKNLPSVQQRTIFTGKGQVTIGKECSFGYKLGGFNYYGCIEIQPRYKDALIEIGDKINTNNNIFICAANHIKIGNNTLIGQNVVIMDFEAHGINPEKRNEVGQIGEVIIDENVWIGNNVTILKNSHIGKNTIVAAGAIVSGNFPENVIIGGIPAKIIKQIDV